MKSIKKIGILLFGIILATNVSLTALAADTSGVEEIGKIYEIRPSQEGEFLGQNGNRAKVQINNEIKKDSRNVMKAKG